MSHQMVTANRLSDGAVVYLTADGGWSTSVNEGHFVTDGEADALLKSADKSVDDCTVVDTYLIAVEGRRNRRSADPVPRAGTGQGADHCADGQRPLATPREASP